MEKIVPLISTRVCIKCNLEKNIKHFSENRNKCISCRGKARNKKLHKNNCKKYYSKNKDEAKNRYLKNNYNINLEYYNKLFKLQDGKCKICYAHQSELTKSLHVNHNHTTGKVRGLLCSNCNTAIGLLKENANSIKNILPYLNE